MIVSSPMKRVLRHPTTARFLACLLLATILTTFEAIIPSTTANYRHRVVVYSDNNIGQIVSAVENLNLPGIKIKVYDQSSALKTLKDFFLQALVLTMGIAMLWLIGNGFHRLIKSILQTEGEKVGS